MALERSEALSRLRTLIGKDLRKLADQYDIPVIHDGRTNKGWAGHVIERFLGLPLNSSRAPNFGSWELKLASFRDQRGQIKVKETIAVTMIDPVEVAAKEFEESHLFSKLRKLVVFGRIWESTREERSLAYSVGEFDLSDPGAYATVKADYDLIRDTIRTRGFKALTGKMGVLIQPRTKGPGHGSKSRAFYARTTFVHQIVQLSQPDVERWRRSELGIWSYLPAEEDR